MSFPMPLARLCLLVGAFAALTSSRPLAQTPSARVTAITGATLIDGTGGAPIADAVVVITGDRITAVGPRSSVPRADIKNIRAIRTLMVGGKVIDRERLPEARVLSRP